MLDVENVRELATAAHEAAQSVTAEIDDPRIRSALEQSEAIARIRAAAGAA